MYKDVDEQELARLCSERNRMAADELYRRYATRVFTLCRRYAGDDDEAKDLMQEALIQALDKIQTFKYFGKGSLQAWISRIAINKAVSQVRRRRWQVVSLDFLQAQDRLPEPTEEEMGVIPEEKLLAWIARLPDVRRTVFNLYCIDGYSHKDIARMLGISEKGSAGVLAKARKQLKEEIRVYLNALDR